MFLASNFFGGSAPEFLEWDYKIQPDSDHVAKFQGDRSRELGERVAKQKKDTSAVKHKPVRNGGSGRPNKVLQVSTNLQVSTSTTLCLKNNPLSFVFIQNFVLINTVWFVKTRS